MEGDTINNMKEQNYTEIDTDTGQGCATIIISLLFWLIIISHCIMRFKNPSMTETQLFLNMPKAFILEEPKWGME